MVDSMLMVHKFDSAVHFYALHCLILDGLDLFDVLILGHRTHKARA